METLIAMSRLQIGRKLPLRVIVRLDDLRVKDCGEHSEVLDA